MTNKTQRRLTSLILAIVITAGLSVSAVELSQAQESDIYAEMLDSLMLEGSPMSLRGLPLEARIDETSRHSDQSQGHDTGSNRSMEPHPYLQKTNRFIVQYREGRAETFALKIGNMLEAAVDISEPMLDTSTGTLSLYSSGNSNASGNGARGGGMTRSESLVQIESPVMRREARNTGLIVLTEPILPSEFAEKLKALGVERDIKYVSPDFKLSLYGAEFGIGAPSMPSDQQRPSPNPQLPGNLRAVGNEVLVAVIDTGIDTSHKAFDGYLHAVAPTTSSVGNALSHGTHVSGIALEAAKSAGADVKLLPIGVFGGATSTAYTSDIIAAIRLADSLGAQVINMSFGSTSYNRPLYDAIAASNALIVASVGNSRRSFDTNPVYPAGYDLPNVISVASVNSDGGASYFTNYGNNIDIAALGRSVYSALPGNKYGEQTGTSMSAAFVSGVAAAVLSRNHMGAAALRDRLIYTADSLSNLQGIVGGGRRVNLGKALAGTQGSNLVLYPADDFNVLGYQRTDDESWQLFSGLSIVQVAAGDGSSYALASDGSLWAWGWNLGGKLGDGTTINRPTPVQVIGLTDVKSISAYADGILALKKDGTVWESIAFWASGVPTQVFGLHDIVSISAGDYHALARDSNGVIWSWGDNYAGQLGIPFWSYSGFPMQIPALSGENITAIAAGGFSSYFLDGNGSVWVTGGQKYGEDWQWWMFTPTLESILDNGELPMKDVDEEVIEERCQCAHHNVRVWRHDLLQPIQEVK